MDYKQNGCTAKRFCWCSYVCNQEAVLGVVTMAFYMLALKFAYFGIGTLFRLTLGENVAIKLSSVILIEEWQCDWIGISQEWCYTVKTAKRLHPVDPLKQAPSTDGTSEQASFN